VALVGMRDVGLELKGVLDAIMNPLANLGKLGGFAGRRLTSMFGPPAVEVRSSALAEDAERLARLVALFGSNVEKLLRRYQESILERQYQLGRVADAAIELYASSCVLHRLDAQLRDHQLAADEPARDQQIGRYYLQTAGRRIRKSLADLWDNDDEETTRAANLALERARSNG
jgi:hypothetical protein